MDRYYTTTNTQYVGFSSQIVGTRFSDDETTILAEAKGTFLSLPSEVVDTIMVDYPGLRGFFEES